MRPRRRSDVDKYNELPARHSITSFARSARANIVAGMVSAWGQQRPRSCETALALESILPWPRFEFVSNQTNPVRTQSGAPIIQSLRTLRTTCQGENPYGNLLRPLLPQGPQQNRRKRYDGKRSALLICDQESLRNLWPTALDGLSPKFTRR